MRIPGSDCRIAETKDYVVREIAWTIIVAGKRKSNFLSLSSWLAVQQPNDSVGHPSPNELWDASCVALPFDGTPPQEGTGEGKTD